MYAEFLEEVSEVLVSLRTQILTLPEPKKKPSRH